MKKLGIILLMSTFAFSAITFNKTMIYKNISGNAEVENGFGLDFDINDNINAVVNRKSTNVITITFMCSFYFIPR